MAVEGGVTIIMREGRSGAFIPENLATEARQKRLLEKLMLAADRIGGMAEAHVKEGLTGEYLQTRRGRLKGSIRYKIETVVGSEPDVKVRVGPDSDIPYARIQELGGVIRPTSKKFLTIPSPYAKTESGVADKPARSFENTYFLRMKVDGKDKLFLMQRTGKSVRLLFTLVRKVKIPATHWLSAPINELEDQGEFHRQWEGAVLEFVAGENARG